MLAWSTPRFAGILRISCYHQSTSIIGASPSCGTEFQKVIEKNSIEQLKINALFFSKKTQIYYLMLLQWYHQLIWSLRESKLLRLCRDLESLFWLSQDLIILGFQQVLILVKLLISQPKLGFNMVFNVNPFTELVEKGYPCFL